MLPKRELMSLVPTDPTAMYPDAAALGGGAPAGAPGADQASGVAGSATEAAPVTGDASGSGSESTSTDDRSETITQSDSASAGP